MPRELHVGKILKGLQAEISLGFSFPHMVTEFEFDRLITVCHESLPFSKLLILNIMDICYFYILFYFYVIQGPR